MNIFNIKMDYHNSVLAGISGQLQDRLQSVLNDAARLVSTKRSTLGDCAFPVALARPWNSLLSFCQACTVTDDVPLRTEVIDDD